MRNEVGELEYRLSLDRALLQDLQTSIMRIQRFGWKSSPEPPYGRLHRVGARLRIVLARFICVLVRTFFSKKNTHTINIPHLTTHDME